MMSQAEDATDSRFGNTNVGWVIFLKAACVIWRRLGGRRIHGEGFYVHIKRSVLEG